MVAAKGLGKPSHAPRKLLQSREHKRALGTDVQNDVELTSLKTWMTAEDAEERNRGGKLS